MQSAETTATGWATQQLAEFVAVVSSAPSEEAAALAAVEHTAEALDAEVAALLHGCEVIAAVGYPEGEVPFGTLGEVAHGAIDPVLDVPGVGACAANAVTLEHPSDAALVVARAAPGGLSREEVSLLRGMAGVTSTTIAMLRLLDGERAAREESERQAGENARLLSALTERQAALEQLAEEQAALRRVATLVAGQPAPGDIFTLVAREAGQLIGADAGAVCRYEPGGWLRVVAVWDAAGNHPPVGARFPLRGDSIAAQLLRTLGRVRLDSYEGLHGPFVQVLRDLGIRSAAGAPIMVEGRPWGALLVSSKEPHPLPADGERRLAGFSELVATAISNAEGRGELAASRARIVAASDEARRRIERDLHDGIQQRIVTLQLQLRELIDARAPESAAQLEQIGSGLQAALDSLREVSRGVHPAILSTGGLGQAVRSLARRSAVPVELELGEMRRLPPPIEVAAYYAVSEALTNTVKHAHASGAEVGLAVVDGSLRVSVRDDGVGGADPGQGSGITGLTDRVEALGGRFSITSPSGGGTSMVLELPVELEAAV